MKNILSEQTKIKRYAEGRIRHRWLIKIAFSTSCLGFMLFAAAAMGAFSPAAAQDILNVGLYADLATVDPHAADFNALTYLIDNVYEPLVDMDDEMTKLVPRLATSWKVSRDGTVYTMSLRRDVVFSDGTPFTSEAVKLSVDRIKAIKKAPYQYVLEIKEVETPDPYTVVFKLARPYSPFQASLRMVFPVSPKAVKEREAKGDLAQGWLNENSAGTGPYMVAKWERGRNLMLLKNEKYWGGWSGKHFSTVNLRPIYESDTQRLMVEKGDLDIAQNISVDALADLAKNPNVSIIKESGTVQTYLFMNAAAPPTSDVRVRKAIAHAWNNDAYKSLMAGLPPRADGPAPNIVLGKGYSIQNPYDYNLDKARKLLTEAGYPKGGFTLKILIQKGDEPKRIQYEVLRSELEKLGIKLEMVVATWPAMIKSLREWGAKKEAATADHFSIFWKPMTTLTPSEFLFQLYHSGAHIDKGGRNYGYFSDPEVDAIIDRATAETDLDVAIELWRKANSMIFDKMPAVPLDKMVDVVVTRKNLKGYKYKVTKIYGNYYKMWRE